MTTKDPGKNNSLVLPLTSLLKAVRIQNLAILVLAQYFTAIFLNGQSLEFLEVLTNLDLLFISVSTVMIAAGGYLINDYYDVKIDYVNHPETVIVGNTLSRRMALFLHTGLSVSGVALGMLVSLYVGAINFFSAFFLWLYSNQLKRLPFIGNFTIGILTSVSVALIAFPFPQGRDLIFVYAFFAGFFSMVREIIKDLQDEKGDAEFGAKTLPVVFGQRRTKVVLYVLALSFLTSFLMLSRIFIASWLPIGIIMATLTAVLLWRVYAADTKKDFGWLSNYCKLILLLGLFSMFFA